MLDEIIPVSEKRFLPYVPSPKSLCLGPLVWIRKFLSARASSFVTSSFLAPKKELTKTLFADGVQKRTA